MGDRLATVFVRQRHDAADPQAAAACPPADVTIDRIADLVDAAGGL